MTEILLETDLDKEQREFATTVLSSGQRLLNVINEILDFSKLDAGLTEILSEPVNVRECVNEVVKLTKQNAASKGIEFECTIDDDVPASILGDTNRLRQVLHNLVGNALKFTEEGSITLTVIVEKRESTAMLRFAVTDTGIGVSPEAAGKIFDSFTQADSSMTREYGGTGLGLAISKQLVELMDGEITFESALEKGSTFSFTVPAEGCR